jgi:uncharacterized membrane protein
MRRRTDVIRVEESVEINRPVDEVFVYTSNPENFPQWVATVMEVRQEVPGGSPLIRKGENFTAMQQALGRRFEAPFEVVDYEPNRRYAHRSTGGHPVPCYYSLHLRAGVGGGDSFTPRIEAEPGGFFGLVGPVLEGAIRRQMRTNLVTLKDLLESRGSRR